MGGGASSIASGQMEEMMAYSVLLGRTITALSFPGMYSIRDFNLNRGEKEKKKPRCKTEEEGDGLTSSPQECDDRNSAASTSSSSDSPSALISTDIEDHFTLRVDGNVIVLDDVTRQVHD
ncbi:unnamed protein product [Choristocarpus tenellus]